MVYEKIYRSGSSTNVEELRRMAILMHQIHVLDLEKSLWATCFRAGTGLLKPNESHRKIWPSMVKKMLQSDQRATTVSDPQQITVDDGHCLRCVQEHQRELDKHQQQLNLKKQQFFGLTTGIEAILQTFLQEHLQPIRSKYECKMKLVEFDYSEQVLRHTFLQQNPCEEQVRLRFAFEIRLWRDPNYIFRRS